MIFLQATSKVSHQQISTVQLHNFLSSYDLLELLYAHNFRYGFTLSSGLYEPNQLATLGTHWCQKDWIRCYRRALVINPTCTLKTRKQYSLSDKRKPLYFGLNKTPTVGKLNSITINHNYKHHYGMWLTQWTDIVKLCLWIHHIQIISILFCWQLCQLCYLTGVLIGISVRHQLELDLHSWCLLPVARFSVHRTKHACDGCVWSNQ